MTRTLTIIDIRVIGDSSLDSTQVKHIEVARMIASWYNGVSSVKAAEVRVKEPGVTIDGLYSTASKSIYLAPHVLRRIDKTVDTDIHEIAHHNTQAPDGTKLHEDEIDRVSEDVIGRIKSGALKGKLKSVAW
jgi:hypothetical protein